MTGARWAIPLLAVGLVAWVDALAGGDLGSGLAGVVATVAAALLAGGRASRAALAASCLAAITLLSVADQVADPGRFALANDGVFYAVLVAGPAVVGVLLAARAHEVAALRTRTEDLTRRRPVVLAAARADEASRVERRVGAALAARLDRVIGGIHAAGRSADARAGLAEAEDQARAALAELREVLGVLGATGSETGPDPVAAPAPAASPAPRRRPHLVDVALASAGVPVAVESVATGTGPPALIVATAVTQGLLLPVVRRRPILGVAALMAVAAVQSAWLAPVPPLVTWFLPGLLSAYLVGLAPRRRTAVAGLLVAIAGAALVMAVTPAGARHPSSLPPSLALGVLAWWAGRVVAARDARRKELFRLADQLVEAERAARRLAVAEERAALVRELHDVGAHALTVVCLQAGAGLRQWDRDPARVDTAVATLAALADGPLTALRRSLSGLAADDTGALDAAALDVLAGLGRAMGLDVEVSVTGARRPLPDAVARAAHRVVQESLTNAARHAARGRVRVGVVYRATDLEVSVADGGPGPAPAALPVNGAGIGLRGMRDRVEACRGRLDYGPDGEGFRVRALLPLGAAVSPG